MSRRQLRSSSSPDVEDELEPGEDFRRLIDSAASWPYELQSVFFSALDLDQPHHEALDGRTVLQYMCSISSGHILREEHLKQLLDEALQTKNVNINARDSETGCTLLHEAIFQCMSCSFVDFLLGHGADPNARNFDDQTPLHYAATQANATFLVSLLRAGGCCNAIASEGIQPLHLAAMKSTSGEECELLIDAGADVDAIDERGASPLTYAMRDAHTRALCVSKLLAHGATPNASHLSISKGADISVQLRRALGIYSNDTNPFLQKIH